MDAPATTQDYLLLMKQLMATADDQSSLLSQRRGVRFVSFAPMVTELQNCPLPKEDLAALWYQPSEVSTFREQAKLIAADIRGGRIVDKDLMRGLEHCTFERQKHKHLTLKCTLHAHQKRQNADYMAIVSKKCTAWNEEVAFVQACHDYCSVYQPSMICKIPKLASIVAPEFPSLLKPTAASGAAWAAGTHKRSSSSTSSNADVAHASRRVVRQRNA
jgi:hypothetical protein